LHGRMWKLSFSSWGSSDWTIDNLSYFKKSDAAYPMFIAKNDSGNVQPITVAPSIASGPSIATRYVLFGTGKYLEVSDRASTAIQSYYMVFDNGTPDADSSDGDSAISGRSRLKKGTVDTDERTISVPTFTLGRATTDTDTETLRSGWYYDFPVSKERQISSATLFGDIIVFGSLIPGASGAAGTCAASGGSGNEYAIKLDSGNGTYRQSAVGILGEPLLMERAPEYSISNSTGKRTKTITTKVIQQGSGGLSTGGSNGTQVQTFTVGRLNWRQINNYLDLKND
jgi:type IV pilus assembly protein PilY1